MSTRTLALGRGPKREGPRLETSPAALAKIYELPQSKKSVKYVAGSKGLYSMSMVIDLGMAWWTLLSAAAAHRFHWRTSAWPG